MINFNFSKSSVRPQQPFSKEVSVAYQKYFQTALMNLELNLLEERIKKQRLN